MTTLEESVAVEVDTSEETEAKTTKKGRRRDLDFTKVRDWHQDLADYVNERSGQDAVTANQVKAILTLKTDWYETDEQKAKRQAVTDQRNEAKKKYEGLSDDQIKVEKAAEKAEKQAEKLRTRVEEALAKAAAIRAGTEASGEDIAAAVQAEQNGAEAEQESGRRLSRRNR